MHEFILLRSCASDAGLLHVVAYSTFMPEMSTDVLAMRSPTLLAVCTFHLHGNGRPS